MYHLGKFITKMVKISFGLPSYILENILYNCYNFKDYEKVKLTK